MEIPKKVLVFKHNAASEGRYSTAVDIRFSYK
jgi:hypothetical protein